MILRSLRFLVFALGNWPRALRWGRCPSALELASYVDGRGSARSRQTLDRHLKHCSDCRENVAVVASVLSARPEPDDSALPNRALLARIEATVLPALQKDEIARRFSVRWVLRRPAYAVFPGYAAGALLACLFVAALVFAIRAGKPMAPAGAEALVCFEQAMERFKAQLLSRVGQSEQGRQLAVFLDRAEKAKHRGEYEGAIGAYRQARAMLASSEREGAVSDCGCCSKRQLVEKVFLPLSEAECLLRSGAYDEALRILRESEEALRTGCEAGNTCLCATCKCLQREIPRMIALCRKQMRHLGAAAAFPIVFANRVKNNPFSQEVCPSCVV